MKNCSIGILCMFVCIGTWAQESFTVAIVPNNTTYAGTGAVDANGDPKKGASFVLTGFIYAGDYFENHCPVNKNCGAKSWGVAEHIGEVVGRWDFRGFTRMDLGEALTKGGTPTFSTQTFAFTEDFAACPGCTIVTEGQDQYGSDENILFTKTIVGGTTQTFRLMRGETEQIIYKQPENKNETGGYNLLVTFQYYKG